LKLVRRANLEALVEIGCAKEISETAEKEKGEH
jgi:hypothetical protein